MHNSPQQNQDFRRALDATNAYWKAQQKAFEANPVAYKKELEKALQAQKVKK